jgi:hypothetical protein
MSDATRGDDNSHKKAITIGILLIPSALILNYLFERLSPFPIGRWSYLLRDLLDLFYPTLCICLLLTGIVFVVGGVTGRTTRQLRQTTFAVVIPLTILYTVFNFGMHFLETGADRLGECFGLEKAASDSNVIPESQRRPGNSSGGCGVRRRGMFLTYYNTVGIYGVTDAASQQRVLDRISEHYRQTRMHPVQVLFYEKENWSIRQGENGVIYRSGRPAKLIRVASIG